MKYSWIWALFVIIPPSILCHIGKKKTAVKYGVNSSLCLGADHLIPGGGGLWFFCEKKDCSANFGK